MANKARRVLLVEDSEDDYVLTRGLLRDSPHESYELSWASSPEAGLEQLVRDAYDVCLVDFFLGPQNGLEFIRDARSAKVDVPLILLTGAQGPEVDAEALRCGAADYLGKTELTAALLDRSIRYAIKHAAAVRQLRRSNEDLERFAYVASHDLQEPLRTISLISELLREALQDQSSAEVQGYAWQIHESAYRLKNEISGLLELSRFSADEERLIAGVDSAAAVRSALQSLSAAIDEASACVFVDALPLVRADLSQLTRVFQNLIENSLKYRKRDVAPNIRISATARDDEWVFSVIDNGIGFDPSQAKNVFKIFKRLHHGTNKGSGIGLAICKRVVDGLGGAIWAESQIGEGAQFHFTLPMCDPLRAEVQSLRPDVHARTVSRGQTR